MIARAHAILVALVVAAAVAAVAAQAPDEPVTPPGDPARGPSETRTPPLAAEQVPDRRATPPPSVPQAPDEAGGAPALEVGLEEEVDVRLVLVDLLVLDRKDRTVPGLERDDFVLVVNGKEVEIASLDVDCPIGTARDPVPGSSRAEGVEETEQPKRLVLVFDYFHATQLAQTYERALEMLNNWPAGNEEHMVVSLGQTIRIEAPFTRDLDDVRWAIQRMRNDPELYAGNYGRLTERRFFESIESLFDLLQRWPGRKSIVLFSGPLIPDGFTHDLEYQLLSGLSTAQRSSIYPVETAGLTFQSEFGGTEGLRRLASETGGRMTSMTNDIGIAYAKAQRDASCTYTLGFYDESPREDRERRLTVHVKGRRGLRAVYPQFYVVRSEKQERESLMRTAAMAPQMFESDEVRAALFVLAPASSDRWHAMMAMEVRLAPDTFVMEDSEWRLRGLVRKRNGTVVHSFDEKLPIAATDVQGGPRPAITVFHSLRVRPGRYIVSAVLTNPDDESPRASTRAVVVSEIPRGEPFLVGPILGRRTADADGVERPAGDDPAFEPLIERQAARGEALDALTVICVVNGDEPVDLQTIGREVTSWEGPGELRFAPASARLAGDRRVDCYEQWDRLATDGLEPGRYEMNVYAETSDFVAGTGSEEFTVRPAVVTD